jgi:hypothetical protein
MPTILGLVGLENRIPAEVQGNNYAEIITNPETSKVKKPAAALYIDFNSRGVYTGQQTMVVVNKDDEATQVYGYNNQKDPNQLTKIPFEELENGLHLKAELERLLKTTEDNWYTLKVCADFLNY